MHGTKYNELLKTFFCQKRKAKKKSINNYFLVTDLNIYYCKFEGKAIIRGISTPSCE